MSLLANHLVGRGHCVHLLTLDAQRPDFYSLDPRVVRKVLDLQDASKSLLEAVYNNIQRVCVLRRALHQTAPDLVISFLDTTNVLTLLATRGRRVPVIVMEQIDPTQYPLSPHWVKLRRLLYPRADAVVSPTDRVATWAKEFVPSDRVHTIPNPVAPPTDQHQEVDLPLPCGHFVAAMGRLHPQKGFDMLLPAFAQCAHRHSEWNLVILGEGKERPHLRGLADDLGIAERVLMPGTIRNPGAVLRKADFFVMSSRFEGLPLALLEALACGLPAVSFDCPTGPREIIRDGIDGLLVPPENVDALAAAMDRLISNPLERQRMAERAPEVLEVWSGYRNGEVGCFD
jgi:glycosyltransferase involved in cell wall biosynthesis